MFPRTAEAAFARYQANGDARALAIVFDRTAPALLQLARHLVLDAALAEDLVQATFLTAMQSAASHEKGRPVLPWLSGILANHARSARRQRRRRPDLARLGDAVSRSVHDVHEELDGRELHAHVLAAIEKLPEVYRPVLRLWLEHGLEAQEIAATLERPAGTVRAQITRGIEQLRRLLPAGVAGAGVAGAGAVACTAGRGLAAVRQTVLAGGQSAGGWTANLFLIALLTMHHKLPVLGAALVAALLTFLLWPTPPDDVRPDPGGLRDAAPVATAAAASGTAPEQAAPSERRNAVAAPAGSTPPVDEPATVDVVVHVREAGTGRALEGIGVALLQDPNVGDIAYLPEFATSDDAGATRFDGAAPGWYYVRVDRIGMASSLHAEGAKTEHTIELPACGEIRGTVVDERGAPVVGATLHTIGASTSPQPITRTDQLGRFLLTNTPHAVLQARHPTHQPSLAHPVQVAAGTPVELTLRLRAADRRLRGVVRDHRGEPLAGAAVAVLPADAARGQPAGSRDARLGALWLRTDAHGAFATSEVGAGEYVCCAAPSDRSLAISHAVADTRAGDAFVELRGEPPTRIHGGFESDGGAPVQVLAFPEQPAAALGQIVNLIGMRTTQLDGDGHFELAGVLPGTVVLRATRGTETIAEQRIELTAGQQFEWRPQVRAASELNVRVTCDGALPASVLVLVHVDRAGSSPQVAHLDRRGRATLPLRATGPVDVTLLEQRGSDFVQLLRRSGVPPTGDLDLELDRLQRPFAHVRGRLVGDDLAPQAGAKLWLQRVDDSGLFAMLHTTTAADGAFVLGPLPAGRYQLLFGSHERPQRLREVEITAAGDERLGDVRPPR